MKKNRFILVFLTLAVLLVAYGILGLSSSKESQLEGFTAGLKFRLSKGETSIEVSDLIPSVSRGMLICFYPGRVEYGEKYLGIASKENEHDHTPRIFASFKEDPTTSHGILEIGPKTYYLLFGDPNGKNNCTSYEGATFSVVNTDKLNHYRLVLSQKP